MIFASVLEGRIPHDPGLLTFMGIVVIHGASLIPNPISRILKSKVVKYTPDINANSSFVDW